MACLDFITKPLSITTLKANREKILDAGTEMHGDLSWSQQDEIATLGVAIAAGTARTLAEASAQLEIISEHLDMLYSEMEGAPAAIQDRWAEICVALRSARAAVLAAA